MAAGSGVRAPTMRETLYKSENGVDDFDTASQESRDESVEREPGFVEDRFRVDRKKLEQMLQLGKHGRACASLTALCHPPTARWFALAFCSFFVAFK